MHNSVVHYSNLSTNDKGIVSYEWIKLTDDNLAADMQVRINIYSPALKKGVAI